MAHHPNNTPPRRRLVLVKPGRCYDFRCAVGEEPLILARIGEMIGDARGGLDRLDAALLHYTLLRKAS